MDGLKKTAEDDDKDLKKKNKGTKLPTFGFKEHNKSGLPVPISHTGPKNSRPVSASQRPSTPKFRKKHVVQPQADIIRKTPPEKITLNRYGFQSNAQADKVAKTTINKVADSRKLGEEGVIRVKVNTLTTTTEPIMVPKKFTETHFQAPNFSPTVRCVAPNNIKTVKTGIPVTPSKVTLHSSHLPRPQYPIKLGRPGSAADHGSPQKHAKMIANNEAKARSKSCPKTRPLERKNSNNQSRFEMNYLKNGLEVTEMIPLPAFRNRSTEKTAPAKHNERQRSLVNKRPETNNFEFSSSSDEEDSTTHGEEKLSRDIMRNEKSSMSLGILRCDQWNDGDAEGEAMATDLLPDGSTPDDITDPTGIAGADKPLRSVLLTIEDQTFAVLAAMSSSDLIENEESPDDLMSISPPLSEAIDLPSSKPTSLELGKGSPNTGSGAGSPSSPTHPSHSLSICSDERDYFDDEIADQPGLVFDDDTEPITSSVGHLSSSATDDATTTILDNIPRNAAQSYVCHLMNMSTNIGQSSMYTSSPCESIASDDLALDYNRNDSSYSLELDNDSRLANSLRTSNCTLQSNFVSGSLSPCSAISSSPFRSSRNSNINSSFENSFSDSGIRLDPNTYQHLFQDIVSIKTMLLRLKRVLTQNELQQINLANPSIKYYDSEEQDQLMDLKRQLILLQQEMEEKNRKICILETQIERYNEKNLNTAIDITSMEKSTSATQTERIKA